MFVTELLCVYLKVRTELLNIFKMSHR